jgi:hypothetical protein
VPRFAALDERSRRCHFQSGCRVAADTLGTQDRPRTVWPDLAIRFGPGAKWSLLGGFSATSLPSRRALVVPVSQQDHHSRDTISEKRLDRQRMSGLSSSFDLLSLHLHDTSTED